MLSRRFGWLAVSIILALVGGRNAQLEGNEVKLLLETPERLYLYQHAEKFLEKSDQVLRTAPNLTPAEKSQLYLMRGDAYFSLQRFKEAETNYDKLIVTDSINKVDVVWRKTRAKAVQSSRRQQLARYQEFIDKYPDYAKGHVSIASTYTHLTNYQTAIEHLDKAIELDPTSDIAHELKAVAYYQLGQYEKAVQVCNKALELRPILASPFPSRAYVLRGITYYHQKKYALAISNLEFARSFPMTDPNAQLRYLGWSYYASRKYYSAARVADEWRARKDKLFIDDDFELLGMTYIAVHRFEDARAVARQLFERVPNHPKVQCVDALALFFLGEEKKAQTVLEKLSRANPGELYYTLAYISMLLASKSAEETDFARANRLVEPLCKDTKKCTPSFLLLCAMIRARVGQREKAITLIEEILERVPPESHRALEAQRILRYFKLRATILFEVTPEKLVRQ